MDSSSFKGEPWPSKGISEYKNIHDGEWGYLIFKDDQWIFDDSRRPTDAEIIERWGDRLAANSLSPDK